MKQALERTIKSNRLLLVICSITIGLAIVSSYAKSEADSRIQLVEQNFDINTNFVFLDEMDNLNNKRLFNTNSDAASFGRN